MRTTPLPAYRNTYGVSEELEDYLEQFLHTIAQSAAARARIGRPPASSEDAALDAVGRLVLSATRPEKQGANTEALKHILRAGGCMRSRDDVAATLGSMNQRGIPTLLNISLDVAYDQGHIRHILLIEPGSLGLPDPHYYMKDDSPILKGFAALKQYRELLQFLSSEFDLPFQLADGIATEAALAPPLAVTKDEKEILLTPLSELEKKFPAIPWGALLAGAGLGARPARVGIISTTWLAVINSLFAELPLTDWRILLSLHTALHALPFLPAPYGTRHFALFGNFLLGQTKRIPQNALTMNILRSAMSEYMSFFFIREYLEPNEKERAKAFVATLLTAAEQRLAGTTWLEASSRRALLKKVKAMRPCIFYPEPVNPPKEVPSLRSDCLLESVYILNADSSRRDWDKLLQKPAADPRARWDEPVYAVNAYYYQELNEIILPAGYFFWPFYDSKRLGWSYGGLGVIIGHEIIHAFDEEGKEIRETGEQRPLWTAKDERVYTQKLKQIIALYERAQVGATHVSGKKTASENLADLGGIAIALDALESALMKAGVNAEKRLAELRDFFWSYAVSWRTVTREKKAVQDVYIDTHAPPQFRVNFVVCQMDAWYEAFGIQTADALYIPPEERIRIF